MKKPRIKFCWHCSRKLYGNHFAEWTPKEDEIPRTVHKECKKDLQRMSKGEESHIADLTHCDDFEEMKKEFENRNKGLVAP